MKLRTALVFAVLAATTSLARADKQPSAAGFWEVKDDDGFTSAWFLFSEKNNVYYARLVKGFRKPGDTKPIKYICDDCPDEKKGAHIMGLTLFWGMKRDGLHYTGGNVLDPRDGSVYHAQMDLSEDGQDLSVRGYLGIPMLGKTQVWHRLPDDAMKKEDIPKEILANGVVNDTGDKKAATADKTKHKAKVDKTKSADNPEAAASPDADKTPEKESQ
jgi:uncharacterized protein (DUF2147 family)